MLIDTKVLLAGVGDAMTQVAGEVADGFVCHGFTTGLTVKAAVYLASGTEREMAAAVDQIRSSIAFYASTPAYRPVL